MEEYWISYNVGEANANIIKLDASTVKLLNENKITWASCIGPHNNPYGPFETRKDAEDALVTEFPDYN